MSAVVPTSKLDASRGRLVANGLLGTAIFIAAEAMFFAALISAYLVLRAQAPGGWPPAGQPRLPVATTGGNTALLLASGYTMLRALREGGARGRWLVATAALGALFLAAQGGEWVRLVAFGLRAESAGNYVGTFYALIGAHGLHLLGGLGVLLAVTVRERRGRYLTDSTGLAMCGMFWLFVVAVWPVLYVLVYLW